MAAKSAAKGRDTALIRAQPGEFVVRKAAVQKLGDKVLRTINRGKLPRKGRK